MRAEACNACFTCGKSAAQELLVGNLTVFLLVLFGAVAVIVGPMMTLRLSAKMRAKRIDPAKLKPNPYADVDEDR